jgi:hypothetical protein
MLRRKSNLATLRERIYVSTSPKRDTTEMRDDDVEPGKEKREKEFKKRRRSFFGMRPSFECVSILKLGLQAKLLPAVLVIVDDDEKMCEFYGEKV